MNNQGNLMTEWGIVPLLWTYRFNWVKRTSWGWCHIMMILTILNLYEWAGKKHFVSLKPEEQSENETTGAGVKDATAIHNFKWLKMCVICEI